MLLEGLDIHPLILSKELGFFFFFFSRFFGSFFFFSNLLFSYPISFFLLDSLPPTNGTE